jgi:hypothetical protein
MRDTIIHPNELDGLFTQEVTMKTAAFAGALVFSFILGGVTTLLGFPRQIPAPTFETAASVSPASLARSAGPLPTLVPDNYF